VGSHTAEEVLVDLLTVRLGNKPEICQFKYLAIGIVNPHIVAVLKVREVRGGWFREFDIDVSVDF
jgi:hypothetical protein